MVYSLNPNRDIKNYLVDEPIYVNVVAAYLDSVLSRIVILPGMNKFLYIGWYKVYVPTLTLA